jgi:hypothetical protein
MGIFTDKSNLRQLQESSPITVIYTNYRNLPQQGSPSSKGDAEIIELVIRIAQ